MLIPMRKSDLVTPGDRTVLNFILLAAYMHQLEPLSNVTLRPWTETRNWLSMRPGSPLTQTNWNDLFSDHRIAIQCDIIDDLNIYLKK